MARSRKHPRLRVYQNGQIVGFLSKQPSGAIDFIYAEEWLSSEHAYPVSLSLPLREDAFKGAPVIAVFENLLPDNEALKALVAEKIGAEGKDAYSLLSRIGRDCVGALQFFPEDVDVDFSNLHTIEGEPVNEEEIEKVLNNLARAPLGLDREQDFRISIAGAQEKTALLFHKGKWLRPSGATPTTHIFKKQISKLPGGVDLKNSVENEFYCLRLMEAFGLPVNKVEMKTFGKTKALVIERFDRVWTKDGRLLRIPQEDFCQALSVTPNLKYQNQGGPGMADILEFLKGSDKPAEDQKAFLKAQILFWLIGATDGHAKNFSIFLGIGGSFALTPFYDVLTAQPLVDERQVERQKMKMAMSVGDNKNHYKMDEIHGRHFIQTAKQAGLPEVIAKEALEEITDKAKKAIEDVKKKLPPDFPEQIHESVKAGMEQRLKSCGASATVL